MVSQQESEDEWSADPHEEEAKAGPEWLRLREYMESIGWMMRDAQPFYWGDGDPRDEPYFFARLDGKDLLVGRTESFSFDYFNEAARDEFYDELDDVVGEWAALAGVDHGTNELRDETLHLEIFNTLKLEGWETLHFDMALGRSAALMGIVKDWAERRLQASP